VSDPNPDSTQDVAARDASLDAGQQDDVGYLKSLGYDQELKRALGLFGSFAIQFSCIAVSIGLYTLYGYGLATSGPTMIWPFIVGASFQMLVGMGVAELISCYPLAGGSYQIASRLGPKMIGWMVGWIVGVSLMSATAAEGLAIAPYVGSWVGIPSPDTTQTLIIAFGSIILITVINVIGIRLSSFINNIGVIAEVFGLTTVLVLLMIAGLVQPVSFFSNTNGTDTVYSGGMIWPFLFTLMMPVWIINGFDSPGHTSEETHNAAVTAPRGLLIANWSSWVYGIIAVVVLTLSISSLKDAAGSSTPIVWIVTDRLGSMVADVLTVIVVASFIVNMQILQLTVARMFFAQARDGQFPFAAVLRKITGEGSPVNATIMVAVVALIMCLWTGGVAVLASFSALGYSFAYGWTNAVGWWARRKGTLPKHPFHYGMFSGPIFAISAIWSVVISAVLIYQNPNQVGGGAVVVVLIGLAIYYVGIPKSRRGLVTEAEIQAVAEASRG
jgi:amino acid transporter